jgi:hypothetical protein
MYHTGGHAPGVKANHLLPHEDSPECGSNHHAQGGTDLLDGLWELAPTPRPVVGTQNGSVPTGRRKKRQESANIAAISRQRDVSEEVEEAAVLTW